MKTSGSSVSEHREVYTKAKGKREGRTRRENDWRVGGQSEGSSSVDAAGIRKSEVKKRRGNERKRQAPPPVFFCKSGRERS
jgi:hypothetical protein